VKRDPGRHIAALPWRATSVLLLRMLRGPAARAGAIVPLCAGRLSHHAQALE